jgi:hypothetical protein
MDKNTYKDKASRQEEAELARMNSLSNSVAYKVETSRITKPESKYRPFELSFGAERLNEIYDFLFSLDEPESDRHLKMNDSLLKLCQIRLCQKFLDWKVEVGSDRLWHEFKKNGSTYVINNAWEQVKKEHEILDTARQAYKEHLNKILEDSPRMPSDDPAYWCSLCDGFSEFEALQEFKYPLPFDTVFGTSLKCHY